MRHAWILVALAAGPTSLTAACGHTEIVVVTATPGPPPRVPPRDEQGRAARLVRNHRDTMERAQDKCWLMSE